MTNKRVAAILTCFNRKEKTLACLKSLFDVLPRAEVYLTDDGCSDGTSTAILNQFSDKVHIIHGTGNYFWSRGMYMAWREAVKADFDFYIWLNDDVELYPFFWQELQDSYKRVSDDSVISGLIESFDRTQILYGGSDSHKKLITASERPQEVTFMNGNVVLIPRCVVERVGIIDPVYHHDLGDVDYGLRVGEAGGHVYTTCRPVAAGYANNYCRVRKWGSSIRQRFKKLNSPLGSPLRLNFYYRKKHFGVFHAIKFCAFLVVLNALPDWVVCRIWGDTYMDK